MKTVRWSRKLMVIGFAALAGIVGCEEDDADDGRQSPDGKYEAIAVDATDGSKHYQVIEVQTRAAMLMTRAQYASPNDVKGAAFSGDSTRFAAAYYYSHAGQYTWVGIWDIRSGALISTRTLDGLVDVPDTVFD